MVSEANSVFWRMTKAEGEAAIAMLKQAVQRFPDYAPAQSMLAFMMLVSGNVGWVAGEPKSVAKQAVAFAIRAAEIDDNDPWAYLALGYVAYIMRRTDKAVEEFQRAIDLNPNFAATHSYLSLPSRSPANRTKRSRMRSRRSA